MSAGKNIRELSEKAKKISNVKAVCFLAKLLSSACTSVKLLFASYTLVKLLFTPYTFLTESADEIIARK